jgi:hypothetical protein
MNIDRTQQQSPTEQSASRRMSEAPEVPPQISAGYSLDRLLGRGAFGEVWVATDQNTGRRVAIKFFAQRQGVDWALLGREVEKLAFLSADRHVVQLLDVGWEAEPPYYVMEYVERGSLDERLKKQGPLSVAQAVEIFQELAVGLLHAHAKGILHCDLKPANVLLDADGKPRIADFGQSRLTHDKTPALGTLFFMPPEQADLQASPDVRWDVYALGAILYTMLTGAPPYRDPRSVTTIESAESLPARLDAYRQVVVDSPVPAAHRTQPGVDRALADVVDRCLAKDPRQRFANVQELLDALQSRAKVRARWPLMMLGAVGPALTILALSFFVWNAFTTLVAQSDEALRAQALEGNRFAAQFAAKTVANELDRRYRTLESFAFSMRFQQYMEELLADEKMTELREQLSDPEFPADQRETVLMEFLQHPLRLQLQNRLEEVYADPGRPTAGSWFVNDAQGLQLARVPQSDTIGRNYGWRNYFTGEDTDRPNTWQPTGEQHIGKTNLSRVYRSQSTNRWNVAISTPVFDDEQLDQFWGIVGLSVEVGRFVNLPPGEEEFSVLVDWRHGAHQGLIMQHPLFDHLMANEGRIPDQFRDYRLKAAELPDTPQTRENFVDPLSRDPLGKSYDKRWLAEMAPVENRDGSTGWLLIVQRSYRATIGTTLAQLARSFWTLGLTAVIVAVGVSALVWVVVIRALSRSGEANLSTKVARLGSGETSRV